MKRMSGLRAYICSTTASRRYDMQEKIRKLHTICINHVHFIFVILRRRTRRRCRHRCRRRTPSHTGQWSTLYTVLNRTRAITLSVARAHKRSQSGTCIYCANYATHRGEKKGNSDSNHWLSSVKNAPIRKGWLYVIDFYLHLKRFHYCDMTTMSFSHSAARSMQIAILSLCHFHVRPPRSETNGRDKVDAANHK